MSQKIIEKDGLKLRQLTELRTNTAKEHQEAMLKRIEYFKQKNLEKSQFNSFIQNTVIKGLSILLSLKTNIDKAIGEKNLEKIHDAIDNILLFGL
ncbi:MAG: hypothetical protein ACTSYC_05745 [Promethearchaeota archaeon]